MGRHALLPLLLLSLIVFDCSDASFVRSFRKLVDSNPKDKETPTTKDSPLPTEKKSDPNPVVGEENMKQENSPSNNATVIAPVPQQQQQPLPKVENGNGGNQKETSNITNTPPPATAPPPPPPVASPPPPAAAPPPVPKKVDDAGKVQEPEKEKNGDVKFTHSATSDTCEGLNTCTDEGDMLACISKMDAKYLVLVLQNRGDGTIRVKLRSDFDTNLGDVDVGKNKAEKVNITQISSGGSTQLTLNAGKGDCVLHTVTPIPEGSFFLRLPTYDKILTPVNGAYFLIVTVIIFGGTYACCLFRKKRRQDEVPYQELEMALPESVSATNMESAEGWDEVWDDDWDDDVAVKSPAARRAGSVSANGLTSRSSNKDGWEDNWDD